jgi:phage terminase large subunit-like protein
VPQQRKPFHGDVLSNKMDEALQKRMEGLQRRVDLEQRVGDVRKARDDFEYYYKSLFCDIQPDIFPWGPHQHFVVRFITWKGWQGVFPTYRMVVMPPGTGKSNIVSKAFASWLVGKYPNLPTCLATSTSMLAVDRSIYLRELVSKDPLYKAVFPDIEPYPVMWRTEQWTMVPKGKNRPESSEPTFRCTGADASIGGIRVQHAVVDDLHNLQNSRSPGERARIKDWYFTQFLSRMQGMTDSWLVMLANIWNGDDLTSVLWGSQQYAVMHMMALYETKDVWCDVILPDNLGGAGPELADWCGISRDKWVWKEKERQLRMVIHDKGPALWPKQIPEATLKRQRRINASRFERVWNGRRHVAKGTLYKEEFFRYWSADNPPKFKGAQQVWDTATEKGEKFDFTGAVLQYIGTDNDLYLADILHERLEAGVALSLAIVCWYLVAKLDEIRVGVVLVEESAYARSNIQEIKRGWDREDFIQRCRKYLNYADAAPTLVKMIRRILEEQDRLPDSIKIPLRPIKVKKGGKDEVHEDAVAYYEAGNVWHLSSLSKLPLLEGELKDYPDGAHDDLADPMAQGVVFHFGVRKPRQERASTTGYMTINLTPVIGGRSVRPTGLETPRRGL